MEFVCCQFLVSWITLFTNAMSTLLVGGKKHATLLQKGSIGRNLEGKLVYEVKSLSQTNIGGVVSRGRIFCVEIGDVVSCTCMTPMLHHLSFSHVITAYRMRCVLHEESNYMPPYYSLSAEEKIW
jgi:hypothetical protein